MRRSLTPSRADGGGGGGERGEDDAASCCIRALSTPSLSFVTSHAPSLSQLVGLQVANWPRLITAAHAERG